MEVSIPSVTKTEVAASASIHPIPYGVAMLGAPRVWALDKTRGEDEKAAVLDTGVDGNHPDLNLAGAVDFTGEGPQDDHGHGSHVAGSIGADGKICGGAPGVELYSVKVLDGNGQGTYEWIAKGIDWCRENGINIINMSLGGPKPPDNRLYEAVVRAYNAGINLIVAGGNFGAINVELGDHVNTIMYPADYDQCVAVTAVNPEKKVPIYSSKGPQAELAFAGDNVLSTWPGGGYMRLSGTSMATGYATAAFTLMRARRKQRGLPVTPAHLRDAMATFAKDLGVRGRDNAYGYGLFSFGFSVHIQYQAGNKTFFVNGEPQEARMAPHIKDDIMWLPIRETANSYEGSVKYDHLNKTVDIIR